MRRHAYPGKRTSSCHCCRRRRHRRRCGCCCCCCCCCRCLRWLVLDANNLADHVRCTRSTDNLGKLVAVARGEVEILNEGRRALAVVGHSHERQLRCHAAHACAGNEGTALLLNPAVDNIAEEGRGAAIGQRVRTQGVQVLVHLLDRGAGRETLSVASVVTHNAGGNRRRREQRGNGGNLQRQRCCPSSENNSGNGAPFDDHAIMKCKKSLFVLGFLLLLR